MIVKTFSKFLQESENFMSEKDIHDYVVSKVEKMKLEHKRTGLKKMSRILSAL